MAPFSVLRFFRDQYRRLPNVDMFRTDLSGRTVIVTGANIGLGLEAARHMASMNPGKLILACRDLRKGMDAVNSIVKATQCSTTECWELDLASFASVKAFAERFQKEGGGRLDILIENAGLAMSAYKATEDGWETTLAVNHLGTCHLALRLLPYLLATPASPPSPRLVIVSSDAHYLVSDLEEAESLNILERLNDEDHCKEKGVMGIRYPVTKLFNVLFARALEIHLPASSALSVNSVHPGFCRSAFGRNDGLFTVMIMFFYKLIMARTTEVGSRTLVHAAVSAEMDGVTGQYLNVCEVNEPSDLVISEKGSLLQQRIWDETLEVLSSVDPNIRPIILQYLSQGVPVRQ